MASATQPETYLDTALAAIGKGRGFESVLDELPVPIYVTDADGLVTYWNRACVEFAGRVPESGRDRWCVTWQIYTTAGDLLPHDKCPMAAAIRQQQPIRDEVAIAMRPDGSRVAFKPYPTPIFDPAGKMTRAINMLVDVSEEQRSALTDQAGRCRRLARATYDRVTTEALSAMAEGFERTAGSLAAKS